MTDIVLIKSDIKFNIPQKDESFRIIVGNTVNIDENPQFAILALTNIDVQKVNVYDITSILTAVVHIRETFPNFIPPISVSDLVDKYISDMFSSSFWRALSNSKDCGFMKMDRRKFPFFHSADKEWKDINMRRPEAPPYPVEFNGEVKTESAITSTNIERKDNWKAIEEKAIALLKISEEKDDDQLIKTITIKLNADEEKIKDIVKYKKLKDEEDYTDSNYDAIEVLEPQFYSNLDEHKSFIKLLCNCGLTKLAKKLLYVLPLTYNHCHIIKHGWFWQAWNDLFVSEHLKNFIIYYAMYIMKLEEIKSYNGVSTSARFVFSLKEAFDISEILPRLGIDKHPLVHLMEPLGYKSSYMPFYLDGLRKINSLDIFKHRLSLATNGLLDNLDLSKYQAVLSGSILVPCAATNPLEKRFATKNISVNASLDDATRPEIDDMGFLTFIECYYPSYRSIKNDEYNIYFEPVQDEESYLKQKDEDLSCDNKPHPDDLERPAGYGVLSDLDISIHAEDFTKFKIQVYALYEELRSRTRTGAIYIRRIRRGNNFKYSLYGPGINRPIDLFWITKSPETFVEQFHLGVVRMYWNGTDLKIMQSCLAALLSGINHDYRWLWSNKAPPIPVIKYAQRGYTTPLNKSERPILIEYLCNKTEWADSIKVQAAIPGNIFNKVHANNIFFMPDITKSGVRYGLRELWEIASPKYVKNPNINNAPVSWTPIVCNYGRIELPYYNISKNSVGEPSLRIINDIISNI
jgi:hypothetical protein